MELLTHSNKLGSGSLTKKVKSIADSWSLTKYVPKMEDQKWDWFSSSLQSANNKIKNDVYFVQNIQWHFANDAAKHLKLTLIMHERVNTAGWQTFYVDYLNFGWIYKYDKNSAKI